MSRTYFLVLVSFGILSLVELESVLKERISCTSDQFQCRDPDGDGNRKCIPKRWRCDFHADCPNASDELDDDCPPPPCNSKTHFTCSTYKYNRTFCIPQHKKCDMTRDCDDNSDEQNCNYRSCTLTDFKCKNQPERCIPENKKCDGYYDCRDKSDEENCDNVRISCELDQFACNSTIKCIDADLKCNHRDDCGDNSDETANCSFPDCDYNQFRCSNHVCIPKGWACDGRSDCTDGSDEKNCTIKCHNDQFFCGEKCIALDLVCDGKQDCKDKNEESECSMKNCESLNCPYKCKPSLTGGRCACPKGYKMSNDSCVDVNECEEWGFCDQKCENKDGSYICSCGAGYKLAKDGNRCNPVEDADLIFTHFNRILRIKKVNKGGNIAQRLLNTTSGSGLDFHWRKKMLFWSDIETRKVYSVKLLDNPDSYDSAKTTEISVPGLTSWSPVSIAVDWIGDKLYVVDVLGQKVDLFELDGRHRTIVIGSNLTSPNDIALDPTRGLMFISDNTRVIKATMSGRDVLPLVTDAVYRANGIAADITSRRIFWCDSLLDYIETVDYEGRNRNFIVRGAAHVPSPSRLVSYGSQLYFTDGTKEGVLSADKYNGANGVRTLFRNRTASREPRAIKAVSSLAQPSDITNPCLTNNGGCQELCVLTRDESNNLGYECACELGKNIVLNNPKNCEETYDFLLYSQHKFVRAQKINPTPSNFKDALQPIVSRSARFVGLDFDSYTDEIYYSDVLQDVIYKTNIKTSKREVVLAAQNEGVEGLALDWISKNLYYIDSKEGTLSVLSTRNSTFRKILLSKLKRPRAVVVHPARGYLFFSEWDRPANISRANSDGTNVTAFRNVLLGWPNGLSIDFLADRLYWCDALLDHIQHAKLDGTDIKTINSRHIKHPFSVVVYREHVYVTDWRLDAIFRLHKETGTEEEIITAVHDSNRLYGVKIYSKSNQVMKNDHPCYESLHGCEKFCFPLNDGNNKLSASCGCPIGEKLKDDGRTCESDPDATEVKSCSNSWHFTCDNQRCIPQSWVCDSDDDCLDGSDEKNCTKPTCSSTEFQCKSGRCIPNSFKCDSDNDCGDHSDEIGCVNVTCESSQFSCENGRCIPMTWKCDSENDCADGSDEGDFCAEKTCSYFQFTCPRSGHCIPNSWRCDGDNDCFDNQDEEGCPPVSCRENQFKCGNLKQCIHDSYKCDGIPDCEDGSDEVGCPTKEGKKCDENKQFKCVKSGVCVPIDWKCDGNPDCEDNSDEANCVNKGCNPGYFKCHNEQKCVHNRYICDGDKDCEDGSDESIKLHACKKEVLCNSHEYLCPGTQTCINITSICDKKPDCPNSSDEGPECEIEHCKAITCSSGKCHPTPLGPLCLCPPGETLEANSTTVCTDFDECSLNLCSQKCINTKGSYKCQCDEGYILEKKDTCKAINASDAFLVISNRRSILLSDLKQNSIERVPVTVENVVATASDMRGKAIFWSDMKTKKIMKVSKNGSTVFDSIEPIISRGLDLVEGVCFDWVGRNLYWVDSRLHTIEVADELGQHRAIISSDNITQPRGIQIDPTPRNRLLFWTDWGEHPRIERMGLDGSNRTIIVDTKIYWPNGLAIDIDTKLVYFADSKLDYIDYCRYDGTGRKQVLASSHYLLHAHSLTLFQDTLYWTDRQLNRILSVQKFHGTNQSVVVHVVSQPLSIHVNHPSLQPKYPNPCEKAKCNQMCVLSPVTSTGYKCLCSPGFVLKNDYDCMQEENTFMMVAKTTQINEVSLDNKQGKKGQFAAVVGIENPVMLDYDRENAQVFWVERKEGQDNGTIWQMDLASMNRTKLVSSTAYSIAFDWLGKNLYIGSKKKKNIELMKMTGEKKYSMVVLSNNYEANSVFAPVSIALAPSSGKLYWLDAGGSAVPSKLAQVNMDGSNPKILTQDIPNPGVLAISKHNIYFTYGFEPSKIDEYDIQKGNRRVLVSENIWRPTSLDVFSEKLYYLDPKYESLTSLQLPKGESSSVLLSNEANLKYAKVYTKRSSSGGHMCGDGGGCAQICIPSENRGRKCGCGTGYKLVDDSTCSPFQSFLIIAQKKMISGWSDDGQAFPDIEVSEPVVAVTYDVAKSTLYYATKSKLYKRKNDTTEKIIETSVGSNGLKGLTLDWAADQLYISNAFPHETFLEIITSDGKYRKVISAKNNPTTLAVNPVKKYLYAIDSGQYPRLGRYNLDGTNFESLVNSGIQKPTKITIDYATGDVYWVDSGLDSIQKVSYDGSNRVVIIRKVPNPVGVTTFKNQIYWVDANLGSVFKKEIDVLSKKKIVKSDLKDLVDVEYYDASNRPRVKDNSCNNGLCEQLCFAETGNGFKCQCANGKSTGYRCTSFDEYLVYATRTEIRSVKLGTDGSSEGEVPFPPIRNLTNVVGLDFDYSENLMLYTQIRPKAKIASFPSNTPTLSNVHTILNESINPEGIAYDWVHNKIYWTDSGNSSIYAMNLDGSQIVMITHVDRPRAIALDPCAGMLYFTDWGLFGTAGSIYRSTMAGTQKKAIVESDLTQPSGLTLDLDNKPPKIYWTDAVREKIERANLDGSNRETLETATIYPFAISVYGDHIYWTDLQLRGVFMADKFTGANMKEIVKRLEESPRDLQIFSRQKQSCTVNVCSINNGGCSQSCHPSLNGTVECKCNSTYKLVNDGKMCVLANMSDCATNKFACSNGKCISRLWACDGENDCEDNSDEDKDFCSYHTCGPNEFRCRNGRCIFKTWKCDFENDCTDGSDEENCEYPKCAEGQFTCGNHKCIPMEQVCNGFNDCKDNKTSDESVTNCGSNSTTCPPTHLRCETTNICVEPFYLCDGDNDCGDNSDENELHCSKRECPDNSFRCPNHRCIPATWHCDGDTDCPDGADEPKDYCNSDKKTCFGNLFTCNNGNCIPRAYICDGDDDCQDGSDEDDTIHQCNNRRCNNETEFFCPENKEWGRSQCIPLKWVCDGDPDCVSGNDENSTLHNCPPPEPCPEEEFTCNNGRCINNVWKCDLDNDCGDGSDEGKFCSNTYPTCSPNEFPCHNFKCIRKSFHCDGEDDCGDYSDEKDCPAKNTTSLCKEDEFQCKSFQKCIPYSKVCDKQVDCDDESDEPLHCFQNECENPAICSQKCVDTKESYKCECEAGYELQSDDKTCVDIDECKEFPCEQTCVNKPGSFFCKCNETLFSRKEDKLSCKKLDGIEPYLVFTNKYYVRNMTLDGKKYAVVQQDLRNVVALDFYYKENYVFFSDVSAKVIYRYDLNSEEKTPIIKHESHGLEGLSLDWLNKKLYWLDRHSKSLEVAEMNGTNRRTLKAGIADPRAIAVSPNEGVLFYTSWNLQAYIGRLNMDGSNFKMILNWEDGVAWPNALTIDFFTKRVYFADAHLDYLDSIDYNGKNRHTVLKGNNVPHVFAVSVFGDRVYYSDWNLKGIASANKRNGSDFTLLRNTTHKPYDIHIWHPLRQVEGYNPCEANNGGCSHLCLLTPKKSGELGHTCACPNQFYLDRDNATCISNCTSAQHRCGGGDAKCIPHYWTCDGERDCADGSDEFQCPERVCRPGQYQCDNKNCTAATTICDSVDDCGDGSDEKLCDSECGEHEFKCNSTGKCILQTWTCDGDADCADGSDEDPQKCNNRECDELTEFKCKNGRCIPKLWQCDFDNDCGDDSDEPAHMCRHKNCTMGWRRCPTWAYYRCIPEWLFCDGKSDCRDGADEDPSKCTKCDPDREFTCSNGRCVPKTWTCDFTNDCGDNSDEHLTTCSVKGYRDCSESEFKCANGKCIPSRFRCDLDDDCQDFSDELSCGNHTCSDTQAQCDSGHCIAKHFKCDGDRDCHDLSDEKNCPPRYPGGKYCPKEKFECKNHLCVSHSDICDGTDDCSDNSDEEPELCSNFSCDKLKRFQCANNKCIPRYQLCDLKDNCGDGSDENNITICKPRIRPCNPLHEFRCANHQCVDKEKVCDLKDDCGDQSDELGCNDKGSCSDTGKSLCEHECVPLAKGGYICTCRRGYIVSKNNPKRCDDVNECEYISQNNCSQTCINVKGSYNCSCQPGFKTGHGAGVYATCRYEKDLSEPQVILGNGPEILSISSTETKYIVRDERRIESMRIRGDFIYWINSHDRNIKRSWLPSKKTGATIGHGQDLNLKSNGKLTSIAIDQVSGNIYWSETDRSGSKPKGKIMVAKSDGRYRRSIIPSSQLLEFPTSLAIDSQMGLLFWADAGSVPKIESSWLDGSKRWTIVTSQIRSPAGLAIDFNHKDRRVYFVDTKLSKIESMKPNGEDRTVIVQGNLVRHPVSLDVFERWIYWINRDSGDILKMDKYGRGVALTYERGFVNPTAILVHHPSKELITQPDPCLSSSCTHLCLPVPGGGFRCACPEGTQHSQFSQPQCDAVFETEPVLPPKCQCLNSGYCKMMNWELTCICDDGFSGPDCNSVDEASKLYYAASKGSILTTVVISFILLLLFGVIGFALYAFFIRKDRFFRNKFGNVAVSFRQGSNMHGVGESASQPDSLTATSSKSFNRSNQRDFNNPLYGEEMPKGDVAILPPSSALERSSPQITIKEFDVNVEDSGKDTQNLVTQSANTSEC